MIHFDTITDIVSSLMASVYFCCTGYYVYVCVSFISFLNLHCSCTVEVNIDDVSCKVPAQVGTEHFEIELLYSKLRL